MMTLEQFQTACSAWLGKPQGSSDEFAQLVRTAFEVLGAYQRDLAAEFEVAESTVSRWAKGTARPHPRIQKQVIRALTRRANRVAERRIGGSTTSPGFAIPMAAKSGS